MPSHPPAPSRAIWIDLDVDEFGTNCVATVSYYNDERYYRTLFPDVQAIQQCTAYDGDETTVITLTDSGPTESTSEATTPTSTFAWETASFLTVTTTIYEPYDESSATPDTSGTIPSPTSEGSLSPLIPTPTSNSSSSPTLACLPQCTVSLPDRERVVWESLVVTFTTTITAATVIPVVNNKTNTTTTITKYNVLPSGYTLPDLNSAGTLVTTLTRSDYLAKTNITTVL